MRGLVLPWCFVACGDSTGDESEPSCADVGADQVVDGAIAPAHDACVVSSTVSSTETLNSYIARITPIGQKETLVHERCYGVDDNGVYELVVHTHGMTEGAWTQDDSIFDANGAIVWFSSSSRGADCPSDASCDSCCADICCSGVPVSGSGTGDPVALRDCVLVSEQGGG